MAPIELYDDEGKKKTFYTKKEKKERAQNAAAAAIFTLIFIAISALIGWITKKILLIIGIKKPTTLHYIITFFLFFLLTYGIVSFLNFNPNSNKTKESSKANQINLLDRKTKSQLINSFKLFKKDKILISKKQFFEILNKNSQVYFHSNSNYSDSVIIINSTNNYRYIHFIEEGAKFKMLGVQGAKERTAKGRINLDIDHEEFIKNDKYQYYSKIKVRDKGNISQWEVNPIDIKYEVSKLGVNIMQNNLTHFSENIRKEFFVDSTTFFSFFPKSNLIKLFEKDVSEPDQSVKDYSDFSNGEIKIKYPKNTEKGNKQLNNTYSDFPKNKETINNEYYQVEKVNMLLKKHNLSRKTKRELKKFLNNPKNKSIDFNVLEKIDSLENKLLSPNTTKKEKKKIKIVVKKLEAKIIYKNK